MSTLPVIPFSTTRQLDVTPLSSWTLALIRSALDAHEVGNFTASARLAEHMMRDDFISGCVAHRQDTILGMPFQLAPAVPGNPVAERLAELAAEWWPRALPEATIKRLLFWDFWLGFAPAQPRWSTRTPWTPAEVEPWDPSWFYWDSSAQTYQVTAGTVAPVRGGSGQWAVHCSDGYARGWMGGAVRSLAFPYWIRLVAQFRDWPTWSETYSQPIKLLKAPVGDKALGEDPLLQEMLKQLRDLARKGVILLPQNINGLEGHDYDVDFFMDPRTAWEGFDRLIKSVERGIALRTLGQNLTTNVTGGSLAATEAHVGVERAIMQGATRNLGTTLRNDVLRPWVRFNYGHALEHLAPIPRWDATTAADRKARMEAVKAFVAAAKENGSTVRVDFRALAAESSIPLEQPIATPPPAGG